MNKSAENVQGLEATSFCSQPKSVVFALVEAHSSEAQKALLGVLKFYCHRHNLSLELVCTQSNTLRRVLGDSDLKIRGTTSIEEFLRQITSGTLRNIHSAVLLSSPGLLTEKLALYADALVLDLRKCGRTGSALVTAALARLMEYKVQDSIVGGEARLSLITSVFRAEEYMSGFLHNITQLQDYESFCHHLFLITDLSDAEHMVLWSRFYKADNLIFIWHRKDPGLYNCWNIGVRLSQTEYVSNANVDDLRHPRQGVALVEALDNNEWASIAAAALLPFETYQPDYRIIPTQNPWYADLAGPFGLSDLGFLRVSDGAETIEPHCLPHCMPVWRRDLHDKYGYFDEDTFGTFADWAFWMKVLRDDNRGILIHDALSYYFINQDSHNRRGDKLQVFHDRVVDEFINDFRQGLTKRSAANVRGTYVRKLCLHGRNQGFGQHRNSFGRLIRALEPLERGADGINLLPFIERTFVWGNDPGEASSSTPRPFTHDWIGVLHVPFDAPLWFQPRVSPEQIFKTEMWQKSLPTCRGIITLSEDLAQDFNFHYPDIPTLSVLHPTELDVHKFEPERYKKRKRLVQAGDWLRKLQAIFQVRAHEHEKIILLKNDTLLYLERDVEQFGDSRNNTVDQRHMVSNKDYDEILSSSVALCLLYGTAANNLVIECMARATPIIVNPLPSIVEYLGRGYPLYANTPSQADALLANTGAIMAAHEYLLELAPKMALGYDDFLHTVGSSEFYQKL